jgi:hypothetical protein
MAAADIAGVVDEVLEEAVVVVAVDELFEHPAARNATTRSPVKAAPHIGRGRGAGRLGESSPPLVRPNVNIVRLPLSTHVRDLPTCKIPPPVSPGLHPTPANGTEVRAPAD